MCPLRRYHFSWLENHCPLKPVLMLDPAKVRAEFISMSKSAHHAACSCAAAAIKDRTERQVALLTNHACTCCERNTPGASPICKFVLQPEVVKWLVAAVCWAQKGRNANHQRQRCKLIKLAHIGGIAAGKSCGANLMLGTAMPEGLGRTTAGHEGNMMRQMAGKWTTAHGRMFDVRVLDTQGIGHGKDHDKELYANLNERYSDQARISAVLLFVNGADPSFPDALLDGITEYYKIFGEALERNFAIVFTHCKLPVYDDDIPLDEQKSELTGKVETEFKKKNLPLPKEIFFVDSLPDTHEGKLTVPSEQSTVSLHLERVRTTFAEFDRLLTWAGQLPPISTLDFHRRSKQAQKHAEIFSNYLEGRLDVKYRVFAMDSGLRLATGDWDGWKSLRNLAWTYDIAEVHLVSSNDSLR